MEAFEQAFQFQPPAHELNEFLLLLDDKGFRLMREVKAYANDNYKA